MADAIGIEGVAQVLKAMERYRVAINREALNGLKRCGMGIIADGQRNLRQNTPPTWATGLLGNSGKVIVNKDDDSVDAGFFDKRTDHSEGYAMYVEYGRPAGKMPPPSAFDTWFLRKFKIKDPKERLSLGWAMAKHIARWGTKPHPFFYPAVDKWKERIIRNTSEAIKKVLAINA